MSGTTHHGPIAATPPWDGVRREHVGPKEGFHHTEGPKYENHPDTGCDYAPACLTCPYEFCVFDDPMAFRRMFLESQAKAMKEAGVSVSAIARTLGLTKRAVYIRLSSKRG